MPLSQNKDYDVENIVSKRIDKGGQIFYFIKWKGYSSKDNTWEPESHVGNCQEMVKAYEAKEAKKNKLKNSSLSTHESRTSMRSTRSSLSAKKSTSQNERSSRSTNRSSPTSRQNRKRVSCHDGIFTEDEDENGYVEKKSMKSGSSKRSRKSTIAIDMKPGVNADVLNTNKLDRIIDVRRNGKTNTVEYHIQLKKAKKAAWIDSDRLMKDYNQQVIKFLEKKYV